MPVSPSSDDYPALYLAVKSPQQLSVLLAQGADPNETTSDGETPLSFASSWGLLDSAEVLLAGGADPNQVVVDGVLDWTPLFFAAESGHAELVRLLLDAGADPLRIDPGGRSALHVALDHRRFEVAAMLAARAPVLIEVEGWSPPLGGLHGRIRVEPAATAIELRVELWNRSEATRSIQVEDPHSLRWMLQRGGLVIPPSYSRTDVLSNPRKVALPPGHTIGWRASLPAGGDVLDLVTDAWKLDERPAMLRATLVIQGGSPAATGSSAPEMLALGPVLLELDTSPAGARGE